MNFEKIETVVIIPTFNGLPYLKECLNSVLQQDYKNFKITVIDDGSSDGTSVYLSTHFPLVDVLVMEKNVGFACAVNKGILYTQNKYHPKYLAILNNDTVVDKNWLKNLTLAIEKSPEIVSVASNMLFYDRPHIINSQGGKFTFKGYGFDINTNKLTTSVKQQPTFVLSSCWGATLIKNTALDVVGLLDETYYSYFEDLDWGYRANLLGYKIIFEPNAIVYHHGSASWNHQLFKKQLLCRRNSIYTIIKNYKFKNIIKALPAIILDYFIIFPAGYLINRKIENRKLVRLFNISFLNRLPFLFIPWLAFYWNFINLPNTLKRRREIQKKRKITDKQVFKLSEIYE